MTKITNLNFTVSAENNLKNFENQNQAHDELEFKLLNGKVLETEDVIWHQAYKGFKFLSGFSQKNKRLSLELRRYIFRNILNGLEINKNFGTESGSVIFKIESGAEYESLTDENLIKIMADALKKCFSKKKISKDINQKFQEYKLEIKPKRLKEILLEGNPERQSLIRICFALGMKLDVFNKFLSQSAFMRTLSPAVPQELILIYCIENNLNWKDVLRLQKIANVYMTENLNLNAPSVTNTAPHLFGVKEDKFKNNILFPCCIEACAKKNFESRQYSKTALDFFIENSIIKDVLNKSTNQIVFRQDNTVYISDIIFNYSQKFSLSEYGFPVIKSNMIISQYIYWRFLNYRIAKKNPATTIYSMKYGSLPQEISNNILEYSKINSISSLYPHRINRYDILTVSFYHYLMTRWSNKRDDFIVSTPKEVSELWLDFFQIANENLENTGYEKISNKNPFDAFLRIAMHSINPLECFTRILELNVISSFAFDDNAKNKYPASRRIRETLAQLRKTYEKLYKNNLVDLTELNELKKFSSLAENKINSTLS